MDFIDSELSVRLIRVSLVVLIWTDFFFSVALFLRLDPLGFDRCTPTAGKTLNAAPSNSFD
jgi:hypothetical protein